MRWILGLLLLASASTASARKPLPPPFDLTTEATGEDREWTVTLTLRANTRLTDVEMALSVPEGAAVQPEAIPHGEVPFGETRVGVFSVTAPSDDPLTCDAKLAAVEAGRGVPTLRTQRLQLRQPAPEPAPQPEPAPDPVVEPEPEPAASACGCTSTPSPTAAFLPLLLLLRTRR